MPELKLTIWGDSNVGLVRKNNEDYLTYFEPGDPQVIEQLGRLYIVADGVGGAATGEVASKYSALKVLHTYFNQPNLKPWQRIKAGMKRANIALVNYIRQNAQARMATTMVAAAINRDELTLVNVGDSRAYLIRNQQVRQLTQDHNLVNEMIRNGVLTEEQAKTARVKNQLTSSLGGHEVFKADVFVEKLQPGDLLFMASDGLCRYAEDLPIIQKIALSGTPEQVVNNGIQYARKSGGQDNITVMLIRVDDVVDTLPMTTDNGTRPIPVDLETVVRDPLTMIARSPEQESKLKEPSAPRGLFKPDPTVAPIPPSDAFSIPGINQAATDEELEDTENLGKHPAEQEDVTRTVTVDSMRLNEVVKPPSVTQPLQFPPEPDLEKTGFVQRTGVRTYMLLIFLSFMIFVLLGILAFTFGGKFFQMRNGIQTPTDTVQAVEQSVMEEKPADTIEIPNETPTVESSTPQHEPTAETPTEAAATETIPAGICLAEVQSGESLGIIIREHFQLSFDANAEYHYRECTGAGETITCGESQVITDNDGIQAGWFIEITEADYALCMEHAGTWFTQP